MVLHNRDILKEVGSLPPPSVVNIEEYNDLLKQNIIKLREYLPNYRPLESDRYMKDLRVVTYKQWQGQIQDNYIIRQLLITTATGEMLDHLSAFLDVWRLKGSKPYAKYRFDLSMALSYDVAIPKDTELTDNSGTYRAYVMEDATIKAGDTSVTVLIELDAFVTATNILTENITTPFSFVSRAFALEEFAHGSESESDDNLRVRAIRSLGKFSTAGSVNAYLYWTYTADSRIDDVVVWGKKGTLEVNVYLYSKEGVDAVMVDRVEAMLSREKVRPLNDDVHIYPATIKSFTLTATIELYDLSSQAYVEELIKKNFNDENFVIGQHLTRSEIIKNLQVKGVYRIPTKFNDIFTDKTEIVQIDGYELTFVEADYEVEND
jgi:phage-related baseplate assembly protein